MKVAIVQNPEEGSRLAASIFIDQVKQNPKTVLGLATGSTPVMMYKLLAEACKAGVVSFKDCQSFTEHDQSYHYFMKTQLFDHIDIDQAKTHVPDGLAKDIGKSCRAYEEAIKAAGGVDIQLLGIGSDGHIAFNEPGCSLACRTHSQVLTQQTIRDNARLFFHDKIDEVPTQAVTMGIGTIMDARKVVLLAFGKGKQDAILGLVEGPVTAMCPCSLHRHLRRRGRRQAPQQGLLQVHLLPDRHLQRLRHAPGTPKGAVPAPFLLSFYHEDTGALSERPADWLIGKQSVTVRRVAPLSLSPSLAFL